MRVARNRFLHADAQKREIEHQKEMESLKKHMSETQASVVSLTQPATKVEEEESETTVKEDPDCWTEGTQATLSQADGITDTLKLTSDTDDDDVGQLTPPARGA